MSKIATIYPNRITIYEDRNATSSIYDQMNRKLDRWDEESKEKSLANLDKEKTTWALSKQTARKIKDSVQILFQLSRPRDITEKKKVKIRGFRASFITLTLPATQDHPDSEIKKCLNRFLVNLRKVYGLKNYVWKAELQKNKSIHFHIILDKYIHHMAVRYYWNKAINHLGYVDAYKEKMSGMDFKEYLELRGGSYEAAARGWDFGSRHNWNNPPTENVQKIDSPRKLSSYLSKYLAKPSNENEDDLTRIKDFGRVWARSQSISAINLVTRWDWSSLREIIKEFSYYREFFHRIDYEWATTLYFKFKKTSPEWRKFISQIFNDIGRSYNYPFPVPLPGAA